MSKKLYHKFIIAHGSINIDDPKFTIPKNINLVLLEHPGQLFGKFDASLLINYISNKINTNRNMDCLNNVVLEIPLIGCKDYFVRIFKSGERLADTTLSFYDTHTQTGIFDWINKNKPSERFKTEFMLQGKSIYTVTPPQFIDPYFSKKILGEIMGEENGIFFFENPGFHRLSNILKYMSKNTPNPQLVFLISCREFASSSMIDLNNSLAQSRYCEDVAKHYQYEIDKLLRYIQTLDMTEYTRNLTHINILSNMRNIFGGNRSVIEYINKIKTA